MPSFQRRVVLAIVLAAEIGGDAACVAADPPVFTVAPIDLDQIREIIPLGAVNPAAGHVLPTDHIYFDYADSKVTVRAPAAGVVRAVRDQFHGFHGDKKIEIQVDENLAYYLTHVAVDPGVDVGIKVTAGQKLGRVAGFSMLDLGASDARVRLAGFVNPSRYPEPTRHTVSQLALFAEPLRTQLYAKVTRDGTDKDGRIDLDKPGRMVGNWFHESLSVEDSARGEPTQSVKQLSFAYDVRDPKAVRVSIGGTVAPRGLYAVLPGTPDPADVAVETGLVRYRLTRLWPDSLKHADESDGLLLVQLINDRELKVEYFAGKNESDVSGFSDRSQRYLR